MSTVEPDEQHRRTCFRLGSALAALGDDDPETARDWVADLSGSDFDVARRLLRRLRCYVDLREQHGADHLRSGAGES